MELDPAVCERARLARDPRFDGRFFIGVRTTGVYCRPICPAIPPRPRNIAFYPSAAAAAEAGFRPCLRCRPEASPGTPAWLGTSATVSRALRLIEDGALDAGGVDELAERLGMGARQLRRLFVEHLGASPKSVASTRRLHFAKKLVDTTDLKLSEIALAAGYRSVRRFNASFLETYGRSPSDLRAARRRRRSVAPDDAFRFRIGYRPPLHRAALLEFLAGRATPGVEQVEGSTWWRSVGDAGAPGWIAVRALDDEPAFELTVGGVLPPRALLGIVERTRRVLDAGADPAEIEGALRRDPFLRPILRRSPGLRLPRAWDPFEMAVRAILGQQVSVKAATTLAGRVAVRFGVPVSFEEAPGLTRLAPGAGDLVDAELESVGVTRARAEAIRGLARAVLDGALRLDGAEPLDDFVERFVRLPGIGPWTAHYVAMRALGDPDAFPSGDLVLRRAVAGDSSITERALVERAEAWRPWRAYATIHLWRHHGLSKLPPAPRRPRPARPAARRR